MDQSDAALNRAFAALADPVRRAIVARLSRGPATLGELAEPFDITLQAVSKHISVLESAGLVWRTREAQRRPVHLDAVALERLTSWIDQYRLEAEARYRRLDAVLAAGQPVPRPRRNQRAAQGPPPRPKERPE
jgi:DNA-binding transcriptional ArsR family regulator